jgi:hypothetical protein
MMVSFLVLTTMKCELHSELGYRSKQAFKQALNPLNDLRNIVAHPTRTLITSTQAIEKLWRDIDRIEELLFALC